MSSNLGKIAAAVFSALGALLAIIVSCITIFSFTTGETSLKNWLSTSPTSESGQGQVSQATSASPLPTSTLKIDQPSGDCASKAGRYFAGTPVCMGDFVLAVDANALSVQNDHLALSLSVKSNASGNKSFRYTPGSIKIADNLGNAYAPIDNCSSADLTSQRQISLKKGGSQAFNSGGPGLDYCSADEWILPTYAASLPADASLLLIKFNGFGPFNGVELVVKLK